MTTKKTCSPILTYITRHYIECLEARLKGIMYILEDLKICRSVKVRNSSVHDSQSLGLLTELVNLLLVSDKIWTKFGIQRKT